MYLLYDKEPFSIDEVLRVILKEKNMSQRKAAHRAGLYDDNVKKWFQKREKAHLGYFGMSRLMNAIGCDIHDIDRVVQEMRQENANKSNTSTPERERPAGTDGS